MSIIIKRKTGLAGMGTRLAVKLNGKTVKKLRHNEECYLELPEETAEVSANQQIFGSRTVSVSEGDQLEINIQGKAIGLYLLAFVLIFSGIISKLLIITLVGLLCAILSLGYSYKNWFVLVVTKSTSGK